MTPNQPGTPARTIRIPDDLWRTVRELAAQQDTTPSEIIRRAITTYTQEQQ